MSTVGQRFDNFLTNIQLTENQIRDAITKHRGVRKVLHNAFYPDNETYKSYADLEREHQLERLADAIETLDIIESYRNYELSSKSYSSYSSTSLLVGSYGKNTAIAPPGDIDILFKIPSNMFKNYDKKPYNGQSRLLQDVREVLKEAYPQTAIRADGQVVVVPFTTFQVEVLPVFETNTEDLYLYPDTNQGGSWKLTNPKAEMKNLSEANNRSKGNTIKLIKMIKAWKQNCDVKIKSMVIELRVVNFLAKWEYYDKSSTYYDWMVRDFFSELIKYVNGTCQVPGLEEIISYGDTWEEKANIALSNATLACEHEGKDDYISATLEWKNIFGYRFEY